MFSLEKFILGTIKEMIGKEPDYKVKQYAIGWYDKSVLTEDNLAEIDVLIENQYIELPFVDVTNDEEFTEETSEYTEDNTEFESESSYEEV